MQQKRSVIFEDWKEAFKQGFDGFILSCGEKTSQDYIDKFSMMQEVSTVFYRSDGVHVNFKREKPPIMNLVKNKKIDLNRILLISSTLLMLLILIFSIMVVVVTLTHKPDEPTIELSKTVIVGNNIVPRDCYMIPTKLDIGYSILVYSYTDGFKFYIEVEDADIFIQEYLSKK